MRHPSQAAMLFLTTVNISTTLMVMWEALDIGLNGLLTSTWSGVITFLPVIIYMLICTK